MALLRTFTLLALAVSSFSQDPAADSIQQYRAALARDPRNSLTHFLLGELLSDQRNFQGAANEFRSALNGDVSHGFASDESFGARP